MDFWVTLSIYQFCKCSIHIVEIHDTCSIFLYHALPNTSNMQCRKTINMRKRFRVGGIILHSAATIATLPKSSESERFIQNSYKMETFSEALNKNSAWRHSSYICSVFLKKPTSSRYNMNELFPTTLESTFVCY